MVGGKLRLSILLKPSLRKTQDEITNFISEFAKKHNDEAVVFDYTEYPEEDEPFTVAAPKLCFKHSRICFMIVSKINDKYISCVGVNARDKYKALLDIFVEDFKSSIGGEVIWESTIQ